MRGARIIRGLTSKSAVRLEPRMLRANTTPRACRFRVSAVDTRVWEELNTGFGSRESVPSDLTFGAWRHAIPLEVARTSHLGYSAAQRGGIHGKSLSIAG